MHLRRLLQHFVIPADNPELLRSQLTALAKQIPLLYFILVVNTLAVCITHFGSTPFWLTVVLPTLLYLATLIRMRHWTRLNIGSLSDAQVAQRLRSTVIFAAALGFLFTAWALAIYPYGGPYEKGHVAFYMGITVVACIFCLMHLKAAALSLTFMVLVPFTLFFAFSDNPVFTAIALNVALVTFAMISVLLAHDRNFRNLIDAQHQLMARQAETQRLSDENYRLANIDSLTGLPNRRCFFSELGKAVIEFEKTDRGFALGLFDLDGFKAVNDLFGHAIGDRLLVTASERLQKFKAESFIIARLGGDEFGVIIKRDLSHAELLDTGRRICAMLSVPYELGGTIAEVSASAGFAICPDAANSSESLMEHADYALYHAKTADRGAPVIFSRDHKSEMHKMTLIDQRLRLADFESELFLVFQPIISLKTEETVCFEALARWKNPSLGSVPPDVFIRAAERSELVNRITEYLFRKALREARNWPEAFGVSFNLSARNIASNETMLRLVTIINESGISPGRINFEITETALMADFDNAREKLRMLRLLGVTISLDDFGTGYSSLSYVHQLQLDSIKIDSAFVRAVDQDPRSLNVIKTVLDLCQNLNLSCVVEGVETEAQYQMIKELGCDRMQGFLTSPPLEVEKIGEYLSREAGRQRQASWGFAA